MLLMSTRPIRQVETTNICNQSAEFKLWWVGSRLEFSQPASGVLDINIGVYLPNPTCAHLSSNKYYSLLKKKKGGMFIPHWLCV